MRLIDADALINELQTYFDRRAEEAEFKGERTIHVTWNDALYYIKKAPTITWPEPLTDKKPSVCDNCERGDYWECYFCCAKCIEDYGECPNPDCDPIGDI